MFVKLQASLFVSSAFKSTALRNSVLYHTSTKLHPQQKSTTSSSLKSFTNDFTKMSKFIDTHTHIDHIMNKLNLKMEEFTSFKEKNFPPDLEACVNVCCDFESFDPTEKLVEFDGIYAAYGIHPHNAKDYTDEIEQRMIKNMSHPKTVAWGEIGLDYHYNMSPPEVQREIFARQLKKAVELNKPIVVHTREAEKDTFDLLKEHVPKDWKLHIHCFTSSKELASQIVNEFPNAFIGFTGVITFKNAHDIRAACSVVPADRVSHIFSLYILIPNHITVT